MKKLLIAGMTIAGAIGVFAQGQLVWNNYENGSVVFHVFSPDVNNPTVEYTGNGSIAYSSSARTGDYPTGTQTYTGTALGGGTTGSGPTGWGNGNNYSVDLIASPGDNVASSTSSSWAVVAGTLETFRTTSAATAGWWNAPSGAVTISGTTSAALGGSSPTSATCIIQAWYNAGGTVQSYAAAVADGYPAGQSAAFNVDGLGGGATQAPYILNGRSFSLVTQVPEPGTIALGVMGAAAFLARRRLKK